MVLTLQLTPPLLENSHWYNIVDPSELVAATGPKEALTFAPASILVDTGFPVTVIRTPVPVVVNEYARALPVTFSVTVKLKVVSR